MDKYLYSAALSDEGYRNARRLNTSIIPDRIVCPECGLASVFQDDAMAARYECENGHAVAAMWADVHVLRADEMGTE